MLLNDFKSVHHRIRTSEDEDMTNDKSENGPIWMTSIGKEKENIFEENDSSMNGKDFLFLFDILAHTCGIEITLRVLTHSDDQFCKIFKPNLPKRYSDNAHVEHLEEDKLKVEWHPSLAELWLHPDNVPSFRSRIIDIDAYEATIFPAEKVENSIRYPAKMKIRQKGADIEEAKQNLLKENDTYRFVYFVFVLKRTSI